MTADIERIKSPGACQRGRTRTPKTMAVFSGAESKEDLTQVNVRIWRRPADWLSMIDDTGTPGWAFAPRAEDK